MLVCFSFSQSVFCESDPFKELENQWKETIRESDQSFSEIDDAWKKAEAKSQEEWDTFIKEVNRLWRDTKASTKKDWVDYSSNLLTRSNVDFKQGEMVIEALVSSEDPDPIRTGNKLIARQLEKAFLTKDSVTKSYLSNQIKTKSGEPVDKSNIKTYIKDEVLATVKIDPIPIKGKDGKDRYKVKTNIILVPDHLKVRAEKYHNEVKAIASSYGMKPQIVMAIIHTESYFNPKARSGAGAYGLMQIIPRFAGKEAYQYLYNEDRVIRPDYLYHPDNNIRLGGTYVHILSSKYLKDITDNTKRYYLAICSYNWGPTAVRNKIIKRYPVKTMSNKSLYELLLNKTPEETSNYLNRVTERTKLYDSLF